MNSRGSAARYTLSQILRSATLQLPQRVFIFFVCHSRAAQAGPVLPQRKILLRDRREDRTVKLYDRGLALLARAARAHGEHDLAAGYRDAGVPPSSTRSRNGFPSTRRVSPLSKFCGLSRAFSSILAAVLFDPAALSIQYRLDICVRHTQRRRYMHLAIARDAYIQIFDPFSGNKYLLHFLEAQ